MYSVKFGWPVLMISQFEKGSGHRLEEKAELDKMPTKWWLNDYSFFGLNPRIY
jgi:hypothetical protein